METVKDPVGCIAFIRPDNHRVEIKRVEDGYMIGECVHGDEFKLSPNHSIYKQVKFKEEN